MVQKSFKEYFLVPEILTPAMMNIKDFNECTRGKKKSSNVGTAIYLEVLAKKKAKYIQLCTYVYIKICAYIHIQKRISTQ